MKKLNRNADQKKFTDFDVSILKEGLERLPYLPRIALKMRFWNECTIQEIAEFLGLEWDEVNGIIKNACLKLRAHCKSDPAFQNQFKIFQVA